MPMRPYREINEAMRLLVAEAENEATHHRARRRAAEWARALLWVMGHGFTDVSKVLDQLRTDADKPGTNPG